VTLLVGTSGYAFKEWKGPFYPVDLPDEEMLRYYASKFPTVEINNTFYRLPRENVVLDWAAQVPPGFVFTLKASQRITHHARLTGNAGELLEYLLRTVRLLGARLGPILFQLPPNMKKDVERLRGFLGLLPNDLRFTMEFRNGSWFDDDVMEALRERQVALCVTDQDGFQSPLTPTAPWGYLRLHRPHYDPAALVDWRKRVESQAWKDAYVFFKHDHADGSGPLAVAEFVAAGT
jgi:uncharacterized protein YecE (DUF72 family)